MACNHELYEMDTATHADGLCPLCLHAKVGRLSAGLVAIASAPKTVGSSVLRSIAYDVAMNGIDGDTAAFQILRRAGIDHEQEGRGIEGDGRKPGANRRA